MDVCGYELLSLQPRGEGVWIWVCVGMGVWGVGKSKDFQQFRNKTGCFQMTKLVVKTCQWSMILFFISAFQPSPAYLIKNKYWAPMIRMIQKGTTALQMQSLPSAPCTKNQKMGGKGPERIFQFLLLHPALLPHPRAQPLSLKDNENSADWVNSWGWPLMPRDQEDFFLGLIHPAWQIMPR